MITPRSALKFDLFAEASRQHKRDEVGDPLQVIARHIDFAELARLVGEPLTTPCLTNPNREEWAPVAV
ncbi:hypothetical protein [Acidovorax sp. GBBC 1281]|uniref:hypothetical protein n=1 Tax=Acidovorax sp. GBBC 1281 TaxID=2940492 RepID=UPI003FA44EA4